jgi:hypothetical protein
MYERRPRKINGVPDDVRPPVLTQDTERQPRKKDDCWPLDVNQQRPPPMEDQDGVQLPKVIHHEEPEATIRSPGNVYVEMLPENSYDVLPSDSDWDSIHEKRPRKINEVPDDIHPPVLTQDTEKQPRKKDGIQPLGVNQQRPPPMKARDRVQLPKVVHHEEPGATIRSPGNVYVEMLPENSYDVLPSDSDRDSIHEKRPRKINEVPDDVHPPVLTQDTEKQPRKKDGIQLLNVNQQRPPPMEDQPSPTSLLRKWAKSQLTGGSWKNALVAALNVNISFCSGDLRWLDTPLVWSLQPQDSRFIALSATISK